ncbi:Fic family protein [hydrothermal vent metagenome]|uniref:Fic family protein n=1 Tax=hydrothermal vent metagenome TaxID=652676 RepID=A0A1W1BGI5_9ZZZZ
MWIWQQDNWTDFKYNTDAILPILSDVMHSIAPLTLLANELEAEKKLQLESKLLLDEALASAKIEGEILNRDSVRSSIANKLGVGKIGQISKNESAFIDVLLESIRKSSYTLTKKNLCQWHNMMFLDKPILNDLIIGDYRNTKMQVISGRYGIKKVHFEAPCDNYNCVEHEMNNFLKWLKTDNINNHYIKAAIAKFYFITIHPFDDGNGRFSRIIAERCLANAENTNIRLYSLSSEIEKNKKEYYNILEKCQKGNLDITEWIIWFLEQVKSAAQNAMHKLYKVRNSTLFWDKYRHIGMNERQRKLVIRLLETDDFKDGISRKKYTNLVKTTDITASRDLKDLTNKCVLLPTGAGRSVKYHLSLKQ